MSATSGRPAERCAITEVDLDALSHGYRYRIMSQASRDRASAAAVGLASGSLALDIGGGPGDHAAVFAAHGLHAVVIDPSMSMALYSPVPVICGKAERLPIRDTAASLAYFHLSIHYCDLAPTFDEVARVLAPGGRVIVWTMAAAHHRSSYLNRWFPTVGRVDESRFASEETIAAAMRIANLGEVEVATVTERRTKTVADFEAAVRAGFVSTLQYVAPPELNAGLEEFRALHPNPLEIIEYDLRLAMIAGSHHARRGN